MAISIGEVAREAGVRTSTIRYYESVGILPAPGRIHGQRRYTPDVFERLKVVRMAQEAGLTLEEIHVLFHGFGEDVPPAERWQAIARRKLLELDEQLHAIARMRSALEATLSCGCVRIEDCAATTV